MIKRHATDERPASSPWLLLVALLLVPALGLLAPRAQAEDEDEADTATEEEAPAEAEAHLAWVMDVAAAKKQAAAENKDLFINFTGSDWCGWCKKLDAEVFEHASFVDAASKDYVFLFLDFPNAPELKAKVVDAKLNQKLNEDYAVGGFPTIILATADGTPYARTGYQAGGPESYLEHLAGFKSQREAIAKLVADTKHEDIEALKAAFPVIAENEFLGWPSFAWTLDAAEKADPEGALDLLPIVQEERRRRLAKTEWEEFVKVLPQSQGEEPDFDKIVPALLALKHQSGGQFLQFAINLTVGLLQSDRPEDAKKILEHIKDDPFFAQQERAKQVLDQITAQVDAAIAAASAPDDDDDDADDDDDDDDEDEEDEEMGGDE